MKTLLVLGGIAGLAYLAYTQGWLTSLGLMPATPAAPISGTVVTTTLVNSKLDAEDYSRANPPISSVA